MHSQFTNTSNLFRIKLQLITRGTESATSSIICTQIPLSSSTKKHAARVFDILFHLQKEESSQQHIQEHELNTAQKKTNLDKEGDRFSPIKNPVVVCQSKIHHLYNVSFPIDFFLLYCLGHLLTGRASTFPFTTAGLCLIAWRPSTAVKTLDEIL